MGRAAACRVQDLAVSDLETCTLAPSESFCEIPPHQRHCLRRVPLRPADHLIHHIPLAVDEHGHGDAADVEGRSGAVVAVGVELEIADAPLLEEAAGHGDAAVTGPVSMSASRRERIRCLAV